MFLAPPPPAWASLLNKPKSQKIVGHWIPKNLGLWIPKNRGTLIFKKSWTMNFQKSWDIDFQKFLDCDIFLNLKNLKFSKIYGIMFWFNFYIDFVWYFDFVDFLILLILLILWKPLHSWKNIYFSYSKYIILRIIAEREEVLREILIIIIII